MELPIADGRLPIAEKATPLELAKALYAKHGLNFQQDLEYHLEFGVVAAMPTCFAMGTAADIQLPSNQGGDRSPAWFIKVATGNLQHLTQLIPFPLPFIAFHRWKSEDPTRLHIYPMELVSRLSRFPQSPIVNRQSAMGSTP